MSAGIAGHVFMMLVYCTPGAHSCKVHFAGGTYPTTSMCAEAAPAWLYYAQQFDKRKPTGAFCEVAAVRPASYSIARRVVEHADCGQEEKHCETRHQAQANSAEDH